MCAFGELLNICVSEPVISLEKQGICPTLSFHIVQMHTLELAKIHIFTSGLISESLSYENDTLCAALVVFGFCYYIHKCLIYFVLKRKLTLLMQSSLY